MTFVRASRLYDAASGCREEVPEAARLRWEADADETELVTDGGRDQDDAEVEQADSYEDPDDSVCTTFRVEPDVVDESGDRVDAWSFECARCGHHTTCTDDPRSYAGRPYACLNCRWVSLVDQDAVESFYAGGYSEEYGGDDDE